MNGSGERKGMGPSPSTSPNPSHFPPPQPEGDNPAKPDIVSSNPAQNLQEKSPRKCPFERVIKFGSRDADLEPLAPGIDGLDSSVVASLPTFFHDNTGTRKRGWSPPVIQIDGPENLKTFLRKDLDFSRLNDIHDDLWSCGRPMNARALHKHLEMSRKIIATEQADLHLLTYSHIIMIKPLPPYLLCAQFWHAFLCDAEPALPDKPTPADRLKQERDDLHKSACGLLLSYIWLIRSELDFKLAKKDDVNLLPDKLEWSDWKILVRQSLQYIDADSLQGVNRRFQFGELRLGRINKIYRLHPRFFTKSFVRGYLYGYNRYAPFLQRNVSWILGTSVLFSLVLSAMQVGTAVKPLQDSNMFNRASYGFVVFSIVLVVAILAFVIFIFSLIYFYNMITAIRSAKYVQRERNKESNKGDA